MQIYVFEIHGWLKKKDFRRNLHEPLRVAEPGLVALPLCTPMASRATTRPRRCTAAQAQFSYN